MISNFVERTAELAPGGGLAIDTPSSFGEDAAGELYIVDLGGGEIYRIESACPAPTNYCVTSPNSVGAGARIDASGDGEFALNNLDLVVTGMPHHSTGVIIYGQGATQIPLANGFLCIAGTLHRLGLATANAFGRATHPFDVHAPPQLVAPGQVWNFQIRYRDAAGGGAGLNLSDAVAVTFCP